MRVMLAKLSEVQCFVQLERGISVLKRLPTYCSVLFSCSYNFTTISLYNSQQLKDKKSRELILQQSIVDQYTAHDGLSTSTFVSLSHNILYAKAKFVNGLHQSLSAYFPDILQTPKLNSMPSTASAKFKARKDHPSTLPGAEVIQKTQIKPALLPAMLSFGQKMETT